MHNSILSPPPKRNNYEFNFAFFSGTSHTGWLVCKTKNFEFHLQATGMQVILTSWPNGRSLCDLDSTHVS